MTRFAFLLTRLFFLLVFTVTSTTTARADCTDPPGKASQQRYDFTGNVLEFCNGTEWVTLAGLNDLTPAAGGLTDSTSVNCSGSLLPLVVSCTATCPDGYWRSGCFAGAGTAVPSGERGCFCAVADPQCTAFCLK